MGPQPVFVPITAISQRCQTGVLVVFNVERRRVVRGSLPTVVYYQQMRRSQQTTAR